MVQKQKQKRQQKQQQEQQHGSCGSACFSVSPATGEVRQPWSHPRTVIRIAFNRPF
jgi:hypothetical protein